MMNSIKTFIFSQKREKKRAFGGTHDKRETRSLTTAIAPWLLSIVALTLTVYIGSGSSAQSTAESNGAQIADANDESEIDRDGITPEQATEIRYSAQRFVYLDLGESYTFQLKDGTQRNIELVSLKEYQDPVVHLTRHADVGVKIDGRPLVLSCAPYVMPTETAGLRIQADTTSAWLQISGQVQLSLWDASDPIVDAGAFCFPLPGYRLLSHGMQAYNEPVHLGDRDGDPVGQRFHHNYGVDLAGFEGRQKVVSCIDGVVVRADPREGDLCIRDDRGFVLYFGHLDSILSKIRVGASVKRGEWVGMLGRRGASGNFSHLHVGAYLSESAMTTGRLNRNLNLYPWLVATYLHETDIGPFAIARPHQTVCTGDRVLFDGSNSIAGRSNITFFQWEFHDGTRVNGPQAEKVYQQPGCYMATLWVKDDHERSDVDFCKVKVFSQSRLEGVIPTLFVTFIPSTDIRPGQPIHFRIWPQSSTVDNIQIDLGDGTVIQNYRPYSAITHSFRNPGIHIVTVTGAAGELPVTQHVKVVVQNETPADYALVWADEFNNDGRPDPRNWTYERGFVRNNELQWYQPENARCENGLLIIEGRREQVLNPRYRPESTNWKQNREYASYTSACLTTQQLHSWTYGRFEMRGRIDTRWLVARLLDTGLRAGLAGVR